MIDDDSNELIPSDGGGDNDENAEDGNADDVQSVTDKWLGYRFYLPEAWRAREENMAHDECGLSACYPSDK